MKILQKLFLKLAVGLWKLITENWKLVAGHLKLTTGYSLLATGFLLVSVVSVQSEVILIDDFNTAEFVNKVGEFNGQWENNPDDKTAGCKASFKKREKGYSLKLEYDIDSAQKYFFLTPTYILDYSAYSIVGLTNNLPHTAFNGFYFLFPGAGLNLSKSKYLIFSVRGSEKDGYTRRFQIELKTKNQPSKYIIDGVTNRWKKFIIPLSVFEKIDNWKSITEFTVVFNENATEKTGAIYLDNIYFSENENEELTETTVREIDILAEKDEAKTEILLAGNVGVSYRWTPERKNEIFHSAGLTIEGKSGILSCRIKSVIEDREFGQAGSQKFIDDYPYTEFNETLPTISIPTIQFNVDKVDPLFNKITVGNIWIGYSPYIISPFWGWRGISVSGRRNDFEQSTFLIKRHYNSFSIGNRSMFYMDNHRLQFVGLYDSETAKLPSSSIINGIVVPSEDWIIKPVSNEYSYLISSLSRFFHYRMNLELIHGYYHNNEIAKADYTDSANPVYSHAISSPTVNSELYEYKLFFDGLPWRGTKFVCSYRDIGTNFKPKYRQEPIVFEDVIADQRGHKIQFEQWHKGFNVNVFYDNIVRNSDKKYYRKTTNFGIGYFGPKEMELKLNKEIRTEEYKNTTMEIDKNEEVESLKIYCKYNFIYPNTPGLKSPFVLKLTLQEDKIYHPATSRKYITHSLQTDVDYKIMTDFGFLISYKTTRFGDSSWEPKGSPYNDNYLNIFANLSF
ncbi:MAG: hypothetical protein ABID79_02910 [Elusimicrobiota bacterium]